MSAETKKQPDLKHAEAVSSPASLGQTVTPEITAADASKPKPASLGEDPVETPVVVLKPVEASEPVVSSPAVQTSAAAPEGSPVHVAPNLLDLVTGRTVTPEEQQAAKAQRDLNEIVHQMLIIGLVISTALMLTGLAFDLVLGREVPTAVPDFGDVFNRVIALRPSGFLALGLLVLIATPILRVIGSILAFLYERDWRFAGITCLVLGVVMVSLVLGKG